MQAAKIAANTFVTKMNEGTDRIGLVSYDEESTVSTDASLGTPFSTVTNKINAITRIMDLRQCARDSNKR